MPAEVIDLDPSPPAAKKAARTTIYALIDPRDGQPRYVGKTACSLNIRFTAHLRDKRSSWKTNWLRSLREAGLRPRIESLEELGEDTGLKEWQEAECFWISYLKSIGASLTNLTQGGEGLSGHTFTDDHRKKIGAAHRGRKRSPETLIRMSESRKNIPNDHLIKLAESQRGKPLKPEHREKIAKAGMGRKHTEETKKKMSLAALGRKCSESAKLNMSLAQKRRTPEHQEKLSASKRGITLSAEHRAKLSAAQRRRSARIRG